LPDGRDRRFTPQRPLIEPVTETRFRVQLNPSAARHWFAFEQEFASLAEEIGNIAPPPKYESKDFRKSSYWGFRGKLDVPKERFVSFPRCERDVDPTPVIAWAGWDPLRLAQAIAAYYERVKNQEGWTPKRRMPLLAGILELLPWLKQWHNGIHPEFQ